MTSREKLIHLNYILIFLVIWLFNVLFQEQLYAYSLEIIVEMIKKQSEFELQVWEFLSYIGAGKVYPYIIMAVLCWSGPIHGFYLQLFYSAQGQIMTTVKLLLAAPRPYMTDDRISLQVCYQGYGNPSGHALMASAFSTIMLLSFYHTEKQRHLTMSQRLKEWKYIGCLAVVIVHSFLQTYNRLPVAAHSIDQILNGAILGFWVAFYFHYCFRTQVLQHVKTLIKPDILEQYNVRLYRSQNITRAVSMYIIFFGIMVLSYFYIDYVYPTPEDWIRRVNEKCNNPPILATFQYVSLYFSQSVALGLGSYIALQFRSAYFPNSCSTFYNWKAFTLRAIFVVSVDLFITYLTDMIPWTVSSLWIIIVFKAQLPSLIRGFIIYAFPDQLLYLLGNTFQWEFTKKSTSQTSSEMSFELLNQQLLPKKKSVSFEDTRNSSSRDNDEESSKGIN
eukprot:403354691